MRNIDEDNITQAVIARHAAAGDARAREVMTSLVQHLHAFAREVKLTEAEWAEGIRFLAECGRMCSERRQEFVLLSDTLGLSMLVTALNQRKPKGCTESTVCGPFHVEGAPHFEHGDDIGHGAKGEPCYVRGQRARARRHADRRRRGAGLAVRRRRRGRRRAACRARTSAARAAS